MLRIKCSLNVIISLQDYKNIFFITKDNTIYFIRVYFMLEIILVNIFNFLNFKDIVPNGFFQTALFRWPTRGCV